MKSKFSIISLVVFLALVKIQVFAQTTSNKGTDFWIAYAGHVDGSASRMTLFLSSDVNTAYEVSANGVIIASGTITANVVRPVFINPNVYEVYIGTSSVVEQNKGINVTTAEPISVYCVISNNARTGGSLILPTVALEQEYYVFSQQNGGTNNLVSPYSEFTILAIKDGTIVEITTTQPDRTGVRSANTAFQITLNRGDIYQYQAEDDLTGSHIKAITGCTPIAVFSGATWSAYCDSGNSRTPSGGDNLYQQLFPVTAWGRNFVSAPFFNTLNGNREIIKIIVAEDNTTINVNGSLVSANGISLNNPYRKGSVLTFSTQGANVIKASSPIAVAQYQTSQTCNLANIGTNASNSPYPGDPEMTILNPIEQTLKDITVYSRLSSVPGVNTNISKYYINVIIKTADISGFTLDGSAISTQFVPIADGEYSYGVVDVTNSSDQHRLKAGGGFVAVAYGYGNVESYAYLAGTDLKNLRSNIQVFKRGGGVSASNFCLGTNFDFILKLPYVTNKITWNLNNGTKIDVIDSTNPETTIEDGQTYYLYRYSLPPSYFASAGRYVLAATIQKPATAICAIDEEIFTTFDVFSPNFSSPNSACVNTEIQFRDTSPLTGGTIRFWAWDFGEGTGSTAANPTYKFLTPGVKTVTLTVNTDLGCELTVTNTIEILPAPKSNFTVVGPLCTQGNIQFTNQSSAVNVVIESQTWDFGNGLTSTDRSPSTVYQAAGTYLVKLTSVSSTGCIDTFVKAITIYDPPEVSFKDPGSCVNDVVSFETAVVKGSITSWLWDFGDGTDDVTQKTRKDATHKYTAAGTYLVKLTATSNQGCPVTFSREIVISGSNPDPVFVVKNSTSLCSNVEVAFENRSTIPFGNITKLEWIFDYRVGGINTVLVDESPELGKIYTYKYPNGNVRTDYKVILKVYSGQLCVVQTVPITVTINPAPIVKFDPISPLCEQSAPIQLVARNENNLAGNGTYSGIGVSANGRFNPAVSGSGNFNIKYTYTTNNGCTDEKNITITVDKLQEVTMPADIDILRGGQKQIDVKASGANLTYKWAPAAGLSAYDIPNPVANPNQTTRYSLTVTSNSCETTYYISVRVHENPIIPNVFSPNGDGKNDIWNIKHLETLVEGNITVFNRYGQKVFYASPYNTAWDGKVNGTDVPVGVYYYIIDPNNGRKKYSGSVTVLR